MDSQKIKIQKFNVGDILTSNLFKKSENIPYVFKTHRVDDNFGVVYYYTKDGFEDTIGYSYVRKASLFEKIFGWLRN